MLHPKKNPTILLPLSTYADTQCVKFIYKPSYYIFSSLSSIMTLLQYWYLSANKCKMGWNIFWRRILNFAWIYCREVILLNTYLEILQKTNCQYIIQKCLINYHKLVVNQFFMITIYFCLKGICNKGQLSPSLGFCYFHELTFLNLKLKWICWISGSKIRNFKKISISMNFYLDAVRRWFKRVPELCLYYFDIVENGNT